MKDYLGTGKSFASKKDYKKALMNFKKALAEDPDQKNVHFEIGKVYYEEHEYVQAIDEFLKEIKINPQFIHAYLLAGKAYKSRGRHEEALSQLKKAQEINRGDKGIEEQVHYEKGQIYFAQKKYDLSIEELIKTLELGPANINAQLLLAIVYENHGSYEDALKLLGKVAETNKGDKGIKAGEYCERALVYFKQKEYELSLKELNKALKIDKPNIKAHLLLAKLYKEQGGYEEALKELGLLTESGAPSKEIRQEISYLKTGIHIEQRKYGLAEKEIKKAITLDDKNCLYHLALSKFYMLALDYDKAIKELYKVMRSEEKDRNTDNEMLGQILQLASEWDKTGGRSKAIQIFENALKLNSPDNTSFKNILTNEIEIAHNKTKLASRVRKLSITVTNRCNLNCKMCVMDRSVVREISEKVKDEIIGALPYLERIAWLGGEVFLYRGFNELLDETIKYPVKQTVTTNGLLLDEETAARIIKNNIWLEISIDGTTKEVYEAIRRGAKFDVLIEKLNMINALKKEINPGYKMSMNVVVIKSNYRQLESFAEFAGKYGISNLNFLIALWKSKEDIAGLDGDILASINKSLKNVERNCKKYNIRFTRDAPDDYLNRPSANNSCYQIGGNIQARKIKNSKCYAPWTSLVLDIQGDVKPAAHCLCSVTTGNLNKESLDEIWNGRKMVAYRKMILSGDIEKVCNLKKNFGRIPFELLQY
ncbi:MAG: tetratricopeptide repeat protein [Elusimicrobia bacterium]|nr:tetratricopeptide repeat protein [Candidatus Liberimonas magnetica]